MAKTAADCPKCGGKFQLDDKWADAECPACHVLMTVDATGGKFSGHLDCSACKGSQTMARASVSRMSADVVFIGWFLLVVSVLGILWGILGFISLVGRDPHAPMSFQAAAAGLGSLLGMSVFFVSSTGVLLGCLLTMRKNVWQCWTCGAIIDRA